ncbi:MAG: cellulase family glycosylhydrolase [Prolixibacteraceae bacterium]
MRASLLVLIVLMVSNACSNKVESVIQIYPDQAISTNFIGNGVQWSAYPHADTENSEWGMLMTDEKWEMNFHRLDYMQPKLFRVMDQANWRYLVGFDDRDQPILNFNTPEIKALEKILDYAQKNNITVLLGEWGTPYKMHDTDHGHSDKFTGANDPKWINAIVEYLNYLIVDQSYTCIKYYNLVNEPNGDWACTNGDFVEWSEGVQLLAEALKTKGLDRYISVAGPDAVTRYDNPRSTYTGSGWVEETAKQLDDIIGIYEVHDYTVHDLVKSGGFKDYHGKIARFAKQMNKQIIFGELGFSRNGQRNQDRAKADPQASEDSQMEVYDFSYGINMADAAIQSMNAGYSGAAAWALDDAMHTLGDLGNINQLKRWGMWNSLGTEICDNPDDENIRPWFYTWSLLCRYFPTGSSIAKTDTTGIEGLRLTAGTYNDDFTVAIVNNSDRDNTISLAVPTNKSLKKFLYVDGVRSVDENNFPRPVQTNIKTKKALELNVPANSFILLTSLEF